MSDGLKRKSNRTGGIRMTIKFKVIVTGSSESDEEVYLIEEKDILKGEQYQTNLGLDFKLQYKVIGEKSVNLILWLTKGDKHKEIKQNFYKGADGIVVLFDTSAEENIDQIIGRIQELRESSPSSSILLIGRNIRNRMNQIVEEYTKQLIREGKVEKKTDLNIDFYDVLDEKGVGPAILDFFARKLLSRTDY